MRVFAFVLPLLLATSAHADDAADTKDPTTALVLSGAGTALPVVLLATHEVQPGSIRDGLAVVGVAGLVIGPSAGHWYAHEGFDLGLGLRLAGAAVVLGGIALAHSDCTQPPQNECGVGEAAFSVLAATALVGAGTIYDIATAPRVARQYHRERTMMIAPLATRTGYGIGVTGRF